MDLSVEFHPEAGEELEASIVWYSARSRDAAEGLADEVERAVRNIAERPAAWPKYYEARRFVLRHYPYSIIYRQNGGQLQVIAVAHAKRKPGYWRGRI